MNRELVLDVSNNRTIDARRLRASNACALIAKATEGTSFLDRTYQLHRNVAHEVGVPFGGYLYLHPNSPGNEAEYFLAWAKPRKGDLEPIVDAETGLAKPEAARALSCLETLAGHGYRPILYGSASYLRAMLDDEVNLRGYRLWEADYARAREPIRHTASVVLWQYTERFRVGLSFYDASHLFVPIGELRIT